MSDLSKETLEKTTETLIQETFIELVKKSLDNQEITKKISIPVTPEITSIINNIIALKPNTFTDIEKVMTEIIKDGKIDSKDIPNLIAVIQLLYQFVYSFKDIKFDSKKRAEVSSSLLKYLIHLLVLERKINIEQDKQALFLTQINVLIDSCIGLVTLSKNLKTKGCFKKLFG